MVAAAAALQPIAASRIASRASVVALAPRGAADRDAERAARSAKSGKLGLALAAVWLLAHIAPLFDVAAVGAVDVPATIASLPTPLLAGLLFPPSDGSPPSADEMLIFNVIAFVGGPLTLASGAFFRVVNGAERPGFDKDPIVKLLGGPAVVRAGRARIREEGFPALFDPNLFRP